MIDVTSYNNNFKTTIPMFLKTEMIIGKTYRQNSIWIRRVITRPSKDNPQPMNVMILSGNSCS